MMSPSSPDLPSVKIQFPQMGTPVCMRNWVKPAGVLMRDQNEGDEDIHSSRWPKAKGMGDLKVRTMWGTLSGGEGPGGPDALTDGQQTEPCARRGAEPRLRGGRRGPGSGIRRMCGDAECSKAFVRDEIGGQGASVGSYVSG